jgi:hypothetical protein
VHLSDLKPGGKEGEKVSARSGKVGFKPSSRLEAARALLAALNYSLCMTTTPLAQLSAEDVQNHMEIRMLCFLLFTSLCRKIERFV